MRLRRTQICPGGHGIPRQQCIVVDLFLLTVKCRGHPTFWREFIPLSAAAEWSRTLFAKKSGPGIPPAGRQAVGCYQLISPDDSTSAMHRCQSFSADGKMSGAPNILASAGHYLRRRAVPESLGAISSYPPTIPRQQCIVVNLFLLTVKCREARTFLLPHNSGHVVADSQKIKARRKHT